LLLLSITGGVLVLAKGGFLGNQGGNAKRQNMINLARDYIAQAEFDRALDLMDRLLIEDSNDQEAKDVRDEALAARAAARLDADARAANAAGANSGGGNSGGPSGVDAAALTAALSQAIAAGRQPSAAEVAAQTKLEADRRKAAEEEKQRQETAAAARAAEDAEKKAADEAEAARRKAQEAELARLSAEKQAQMRAVNDLVSQGRSLLEKGDSAGAAEAFKEALSRVPAGDTRFESQKRAEIAEGWYEAGAKQSDTDEGRKDMAEAGEQARAALAADSSQALPP
jgi:hypothetical protein